MIGVCIRLMRTVLQDQTAIKNGPVTEFISVVMDLMAFKAKAKISAALHHVYEAKSALCNRGVPLPRTSQKFM